MAGFNYAEMARITAREIRQLELGLAKVRRRAAVTADERIKKNHDILILEDMLYEQRDLYKFFSRRAAERGQS